MSASIKISKDLYDRVREYSERSNVGIKEVIEEAVKAYIIGSEASFDKPIKQVQSKIITTQFDGRCKVCRGEVKSGTLVYYVRYVFQDGSSKSFVICLDCYFKDTALAEWYIRKKKLEHVVRGLEKKADELVKEIESLEVKRDLSRLKKEVAELYEDFKSFVFNEESKKLDEVLSRIDHLEEKVRELEDYVKATTTTIKRKVRVEAK
ncbi:MAG: hypothetical protein QW599_05450 [Nitrososphaerota archaeon]